MTTVDKLAANPTVTVVARVAMFLTPVMVSIALFILGNYLTSQAAAMGAFAERVEAVEQASGAVTARVTTIETRINIWQQQGEKYQDQVLSQLSQLQQQNLETQKAIARLEAKLQ